MFEVQCQFGSHSILWKNSDSTLKVTEMVMGAQRHFKMATITAFGPKRSQELEFKAFKNCK